MTASDAAMVTDVREAVAGEIDRLEQKLTRLRQARSVLGGLLGDAQEPVVSVQVITPALPASLSEEAPAPVPETAVQKGTGKRKATKARKAKPGQGKSAQPRLTPVQVAEFRQMWKDLVPSVTIAAHFGKDRSWVHWRARTLGLAARPAAPPSKPVEQPRPAPILADEADPLHGLKRRCGNCDNLTRQNPCAHCGHRA